MNRLSKSVNRGFDVCTRDYVYPSGIMPTWILVRGFVLRGYCPGRTL